MLVRLAPIIFVLLWSTGFVGARFGLPYADPLTFSALRFAIVAVIVAAIAVGRGNAFPRDPWSYIHVAICGILLHSCFVGGVFYAVDRGMSVSVAAVITGAQPLLTVFLALPLLGERPTRFQGIGFLVGFVGLCMVVMPSYESGTTDLAGLVGCVVGLLGITVGTIYQKRFVPELDLFVGATIQFCAAAVVCWLWALSFEQMQITWNLTVVLTMAWLCLALSVGAISILMQLIKRGAASHVSSLFYLVPPITAIQGYLFFGQALSIAQCVGIAVAAGGVAMIVGRRATLSSDSSNA